jgi:hypothetical protein
MDEYENVSMISGYWSMDPLAQTPSNPGLSPILVNPCNSRESDSSSSSAVGEGGHRGRLFQNSMANHSKKNQEYN